MPISRRLRAQISGRVGAACGERALSGPATFAGVSIGRVYTCGVDHYIIATEPITSHSFLEAAMRAELQKLVDSIKEALVLLRRHL